MDTLNASELESSEKLNYRTRGNSTPQGKERVYFTCHPKDFDACFETICEEIFKTQNCAIYYKKDPGEAWDEEEMETDLGRMQLFVIPITSNFLYQDNSAREIEFRFALEHTIPILPLMQERGLETEFNRICGDLQFLDKTAISNDPTSLPYEEKLADFLASVLVGDELAEKVRDAFDAYIFMSYRKKDRKHAQELMRLIHKNEFCRDIAIWYDEFLVPGEHFNQAIRDAMEKSDLFAFVVTPNLLEPDNYVMSTEYPKAKNAGKPILPAELEETDRKLLNKYFADIPDPTDAHNDQALTDALIEKISRLDIMGNNSDPVHLFFVGLAYLSGIDVEVDYERGVYMINKAAEADLPEAMKKLSEMYKFGEGVERDYEKAAFWLEQLADCREKEYKKSGSEEDGKAWYYALWEAGYAWLEIHRLDQSRNMWNKALSALESMFQEFGGLEIPRTMAVCYTMLGNISRQEDKLNEAKEWLRKSVEISEMIFRETGMVSSGQDLSVGYGELGNICMLEGKLDEAEDYFRRDLEISEALNRERGTVADKRNVSACYGYLYKTCSQKGNLNEAKKWNQKEQDLNEEIYQETKEPEDRRRLIVVYSNMGDLFDKERRPAEAEEWYQKALELAIEAQREMNSVEIQRDLTYLFQKMGDVCMAEEHWEEAEEWCQKGLESAEAFHNAVDTVEARRFLHQSYGKMGNVCEAKRDPKQAEQYYRKELELCEDLAKEVGTLQAWDELAVCYFCLGKLFKAEMGLPFLRQAEKIWEMIAEQCPQMPMFVRKLEIVREVIAEREE